MENLILISIGAVAGANLRYWVGDWAAQRFGTGFPYGTLIINLMGTFILGFFVTLATERFLLDPRWRLLIAVGFCGSYTTFSTYMFESVTLLATGQYGAGLVNLFGSLVLGVAVMVAALVLARLI